MNAYHVKVFPTKILIDKDGLILWKGVGSHEGELDKQLARVFGE